METYPKRLIEVDLPIKRISEYARAEKDSRLGHIPRVHIYPAARPVAACRAVVCASIWPDPADKNCPESFRSVVRTQMHNWATNHLNLAGEDSFKRFVRIQKKTAILVDPFELREALLDFIADFSNWHNATIPEYLGVAQTLTETAHYAIGGEIGTRPLVIDPFAGGGAIALEAMRIGTDAFSSDLNTVANIIQKVILDYIPRYGDRLAEAISGWLNWLKPRELDLLGDLFPDDSSGATPVAYLWARTVLSETPDGEEYPIEIPMLRSMWLARQKNRKRALRWVRDGRGIVKTEIVNAKYANGEGRIVRRPLLKIFIPTNPSEVEKGTVARNAVTCPVTGFTMSAKSVEKQLNPRFGGARDARLYCVVIDRPDAPRDFRLPNDDDLLPLDIAANHYRRKNKSSALYSFDPDEPIPQHMTGVIGAAIYGHKTWGSLFTYRQLYALNKYSDLAKEYAKGIADNDSDFNRAVIATLGLLIDRLADLNSSLCVWQLNTPNTAHVFGRWALPMIMDFGEVNPLANAGGSPKSAVRRLIAYIKDSSISFKGDVEVQQCDAVFHPLPNDSSDLLFTDPPYYNAIPYADLMDFFYVWLKRTTGHVFSELFTEVLCHKDKELCELSGWDAERYAHKDKCFFESGMMQAARRAREIIKPNGLGVIVFAHKSTSGWEALLQAIVEAGWLITASWPIDTEMGSRLRAKGSAALASSIHLVCRPRENPDGTIRQDNIGDWRDVLAELPKRIHEWMPRLAEEGVVGADAIFACLGPALEIYSRYSSVEKASGEKVELKEYLEQVWAAVSREALKMIFEGADASGFEEDARLTAMWLWTLRTTGENGGESEDDEEKIKSIVGYSLEYDAARKIAQGLGAHLENLGHLVKIKGDTATLLSAGARTRYLFGKDAGEAPKGRKRKKSKQQKFDFMGELKEMEEESGDWAGDLSGRAGSTVLDQLHQSMILFGAGRGEAVKRFLVEDGIGMNPLYWRLAQALSALYLSGTDEKRWVDGVLARKKGLGF